MRNSPNLPILLDELKKILKRKKIKYTDLADKLEMSESSVKRIMSGSDLPFSKIEAICEIAGIDVFDLMALCQEKKSGEFIPNEAQDRFFARHTHFFYFFNHMYEENLSVAEMKKKFKLNNKSINLYLKKLEELEILERHPGDRIVWKVSGFINLEISEKLASHVFELSIKNYASTISDLKKIKALGEHHPVHFSISGYRITDESAKKFARRFEDLNKELAEVAERERKAYAIDELTHYSRVDSMLPVKLYYEEIPNL